eukprot:TRINITY_DN3824_c0_g1_i1.p1 TRINITY_DN3824_c0_g1~~TRINITY_DN3824_c0_g1_i1.p1  ORF type:complete len:355 (+),score=63.91 TRINITY_DN3824_c0_g1_i1:14-1078(+)
MGQKSTTQSLIDDTLQLTTTTLFTPGEQPTEGYRETDPISKLGPLFKIPSGICSDNQGHIYISDSGNHRIRCMEVDTMATYMIAGSSVGNVNGTRLGSKFNVPMGMCFDGDGNLLVADKYSSRIVKVHMDQDLVETFAGQFDGFGDGDSLEEARFMQPSDITPDRFGGFIVSDGGNGRIRRIYNGQVETIAGNGIMTLLDSEDALTGSFQVPQNVSCMQDGSVIVADTYNQVLRKITTDGRLITLPRTGSLSNIYSVHCDKQDNILFGCGNQIWMMARDETVHRLAGQESTGYEDGESAKFNQVCGICVDNFHNIYLTDRANNCVRAHTIICSISQVDVMKIINTNTTHLIKFS